jgi:hypothetical protein
MVIVVARNTLVVGRRGAPVNVTIDRGRWGWTAMASRDIRRHFIIM